MDIWAPSWKSQSSASGAPVRSEPDRRTPPESPPTAAPFANRPAISLTTCQIEMFRRLVLRPNLPFPNFADAAEPTTPRDSLSGGETCRCREGAKITAFRSSEGSDAVATLPCHHCSGRNQVPNSQCCVTPVLLSLEKSCPGAPRKCRRVDRVAETRLPRGTAGNDDDIRRPVKRRLTFHQQPTTEAW